MKIVIPSILIFCASLYTAANAQTPCTAPTFWIVNSFHELHELQLSGDSVINNGIILNNVPGVSLAYCNNLNGGNKSPTFYTSGAYNNDVWYFNDTGWVKFEGPANAALPNCGGNGNFLYFLNNINVGLPLYNYSADSLHNIFVSSTLAWTVADAAVDDSGYAWCFLGPNGGNITTDSIYVFSPTGQIVHQYAFNMATTGAYGATFINGKLYIGIESTQTYVNHLYRLALNGNTVTVDTIIQLPFLGSTDMASCNNHPALNGVAKVPATASVHLFPNPAGSQLNVMLPAPCAVTVFNITGQQVYHNPLAKDNLSIDVSAFAEGFYFLQTTSANGNGQSGNQKFIVAR